MDSYANSIGSSEPLELVLEGSFEDESFELRFSDPDVLAVLQRAEGDKGAVVETMIRVGTYALQASSTGLDMRAVRLELERAAGHATQALSDVQTHVAATMGDGGPFTAAMDTACANLMNAVREVIARQSDGDVPGTLIAKVQAGTKAIETVLSGVREKIRADLREAGDRQTDALNKAVRDVRDLDPASAVGLAFSRIEKAVVDLTALVAASGAAQRERERGTAKGGDYEDDVAMSVASIAQVYGDRAEQTGKHPGCSIANKRPSFRGDITCYAGDVPLIVFEAMDRNRGVLTSKLVAAELDEAIVNRGARSGIAILSSTDNALMCQQPLQILGTNKWAVVVGKDGGSVLALKIAYRLARETANRADTPDSIVDVERIKGGLGEINRGLGLLSDVKTQLSNIRGCETKASDGLTRYERDISATVLRLISELIATPTSEAA